MTTIAFGLDKSGSMCNMGTEPVDCLNSFFDKQKENGDFTASLIFFNDTIESVYKNINGKDIVRLKNEDYKPEGLTSLYDAIGFIIDEHKEKKDVIVVILTDGLENSSKKYTSSEIKKTITIMEKENNWKFIYLAANQDSFAVGEQIGINTTCNYEYTVDGFRNIMRTLSDNVSRCISSEIDKKDLKF